MRLFTKPTSLAVIASFALLGAGTLAAPPALAAAGEGCPNEQVRAESNVNPATGQPYSLGLPECRAYEMVSPLEKQQHDALALNKTAGRVVVAPDGSSADWFSEGAYANPENYKVASTKPINPYVATRSATGWNTRSAFPPASLISEPFPGNGGVLISRDFATESDCGAASVAAIRCALRDGEGSWMATSEFTAPIGEGVASDPLIGASSNSDDVLFHGEPGVPFLPADSSSRLGCGGAHCGGIYEISGLGTESAQLRLVDVDDSGAMIGPEGESAVGAVHGSDYQAISADGSRIFFTATPSGGVPTIYARVNNVETLAISAPECEGKCRNEESGTATYQGASADGSKVFFTTKQQLLPGDTDEEEDLYEYDFADPLGHRLVDISGGGLGDATPGVSAAVAGVLGVSEDGSHIYFACSGVLTTLPNGLGQVASASLDSGSENVYGYDTETGETRFVATLPAADTQLWGTEVYEASGSSNIRLVQTTPDGRYLVFSTYAKLITSGPEADTDEVQDVYRYDFATGALLRVSIGHDGASSNGNAPADNAVLGPEDDGSEGASPSANSATRTISENGETIAFMTAEPLQDTDAVSDAATTSCASGGVVTIGGPGCEIYVWHAGSVSMVSDGEDPVGVLYGGMSPSGADIFFQTRTELVRQDTDALGDIYDARVDGGFPAPTPESSCAGETCQGSPSATPTFTAPGTASFTGSANQAAAPFEEVPEPQGKPKPKPPTETQKLANSLKRCKHDRSRQKRIRCERSAKTRYGSTKKPRRKT
jgi:hypothetical protein